jgi:hypothetical protein
VTESLHCAHSHVKVHVDVEPQQRHVVTFGNIEPGTRYASTGYSLPCHVTRRYATTLSFTTSLHDSTTTINDPQQRPQQTDPRLSFTSIPRPRAAAIEARVTFIFFIHEGSGTHFCPFLVDLAPYPYRSENKRKLLLQIAGIMQAQTMRDGADSCRTPLRFP